MTQQKRIVAVRDFDEADRKKKRGRIALPENPGNLSKDELARLEASVKAAVKDGYVSCPTGWQVARDAGVSRLDVGVMIDRLGIRVTECQLGCFSVSKTPYTGSGTDAVDEGVANRVETLREAGELTCPNVFTLARELRLKPRSVADVANVRGYKIRQCQLGCF